MHVVRTCGEPQPEIIGAANAADANEPRLGSGGAEDGGEHNGFGLATLTNAFPSDAARIPFKVRVLVPIEHNGRDAVDSAECSGIRLDGFDEFGCLWQLGE